MRLPPVSAALLIFLVALQGIFVGHKLIHDSPTSFERCAICHVTGHASATMPAAGTLVFLAFAYVASWFPRESRAALTPLAFRRASRAPPLLRI